MKNTVLLHKFLVVLLMSYLGKAVPQHTYGGAGGRGCIASTHS
jgi:hypothetical protein